jgi:hypothetical protein
MALIADTLLAINYRYSAEDLWNSSNVLQKSEGFNFRYSAYRILLRVKGNYLRIKNINIR